MHVDNIKSFICPTNAHINYSKIIELLKTFKTTIIAPTFCTVHDIHTQRDGTKYAATALKT